MTRSLLVVALLFASTSCRRHEAPAPSPRPGHVMLDPERERLLKPDVIVAKLGLRPGMTVADLGAGPGMLTPRLARAVSPGGRVIATDIDARALELLDERVRAAGLDNVTTKRVAPDNSGLEPASVDLALLCHVDTFLHDRGGWLARLAPALKPGARVAVVGYLPDRALLVEDAQRAGYHVVDEAPATLLPLQYLLFLSR